MVSFRSSIAWRCWICPLSNSCLNFPAQKFSSFHYLFPSSGSSLFSCPVGRIIQGEVVIVCWSTSMQKRGSDVEQPISWIYKLLVVVQISILRNHVCEVFTTFIFWLSKGTISLHHFMMKVRWWIIRSRVPFDLEDCQILFEWSW